MNSKLREKGKKEEGRRLREFVDTAYRLDPRVAARKEMQAAERSVGWYSTTLCTVQVTAVLCVKNQPLRYSQEGERIMRKITWAEQPAALQDRAR
jgi:hypothetical protein